MVRKISPLTTVLKNTQNPEYNIAIESYLTNHIPRLLNNIGICNPNTQNDLRTKIIKAAQGMWNRTYAPTATNLSIIFIEKDKNIVNVSMIISQRKTQEIALGTIKTTRNQLGIAVHKEFTPCEAPK